MKNRAIIFKISTIFLLHFPCIMNAQQIGPLRKTFEKNHYSPRILDDKFSKQVFNRFINTLDPYHLYFTAVQIKELSSYKLLLDDEFKGTSWKFLPLVTNLYKERLSKIQIFI